MPDELASTQILKSTAISVVKHFLSIGAAYLIAKGLVAPTILTEGNVAVLASGVVAGGISLGWIIQGKLKTRNLVIAAKNAPADTPMSVIKTEAAALPLLPK